MAAGSPNGIRGSATVQALLDTAERLASDRGAAEVSSAYIVLAAVDGRLGRLASVFEKFRVTREDVERRAGRLLSADPHKAKGPLAPAPDTAAAVTRAADMALATGKPHYEPEDLIHALLSDRSSDASRILSAFGLTCDRLDQELRVPASAGGAQLGADAQACPFHAGAMPCASGAAGAVCAGAPAVPGLEGEMRDLEARFQALCENHNAMREKLEGLTRVMRVLWVGGLVLVVLIGALLVRTLR